jgi:hypothetical protein
MRILPQVELGDGLPTQVCNECVAHLNAALTFKEKCLTADSILRHLLDSAVSGVLLFYFACSGCVVFTECGVVYSSKKHKIIRNCMRRRECQVIQVTCTAVFGKQWYTS